MEEQIEQIKLREQDNIIMNELIKLSLDDDTINIIDKAIGEITTIEISWGILLILDLAVYEKLITNKQANDIIRYTKSNTICDIEMLKDLKFIKLDDDLKQQIK